MSHTPATAEMRFLVLGIGNTLRQDEGLGVTAVERLRSAYALPENVRAVDGGTMGLELLPLVESVDALVIVDALDNGGRPGTVERLEGSEIVSALRKKLSLHETGLHELLGVSALRGTLPRRRVLWGVTPAALGWGTQLTEVVSRAVDCAVSSVVSELRAWGVEIAAG